MTRAELFETVFDMKPDFVINECDGMFFYETLEDDDLQAIKDRMSDFIKQKEKADAMEFARWVVEKIFSGMLEEDPELFCELACRRLLKLGIVKVKNSKEWQIVGTPLDDMIKKLNGNMSQEDILQKRLPEPYEAEQEDESNDN